MAAAGGSRIRQIKIGTVYPATMGMLPTFLAKIARKFPEVKIHIAAGNTGDIIPGERPDQSRLYPAGGKHRRLALLLDCP